jgi:hypothetical protein
LLLSLLVDSNLLMQNGARSRGSLSYTLHSLYGGAGGFHSLYRGADDVYSLYGRADDGHSLYAGPGHVHNLHGRVRFFFINIRKARYIVYLVFHSVLFLAEHICNF